MSKYITQNAFWVVFGAILLGLIVPNVSHVLRPYTFYFLFIVMVCALMRLSHPAQSGGAHKARMCGLLIWQLILTPIAVWAVVSWIELPAPISTALIACACAGPVFSTPAFAKLMGLDDGITIQNLVLASLLMPISLLAAGHFILPVQPDIDLSVFTLRVGVFLAVPFVIGFVYRKVSTQNFQTRAASPILSVSTMSLALMACSLMDGITVKAIESPMEMGTLVALAIGFNLCLQASSVFAFKAMGRDFAINAGLVCGYRNWALTLALTAGTLGETFTTFVAIGQFGVMLFPLPSLKFYKKILSHEAR